ncbi:cytochrome c oxidase assembly protein [Actinomycetospora chibensis]|uniref:Cytochrome c oxidase assembly protein n=1 Tax=Actinomycetospora chibensis TaxID=663606 RepID=A0ABV9RFL8_9PSEU|nr:cytochrome c oxidase assembly protein [Actinomycetospora chibensis]MDD7925680.1 cytochrome c oxidase assembly protein [Actinomycetospora chibensis]
MTRRPGIAGPIAGALLGVLAAAVAVLVRGPVGYPDLGLPDPGLAVRVAVPVLRTVVDLAGAATVGGLLVALVVSTPPAGDEPFSAEGRRALGVARWAAWVGAAGAALSVPATLADSTGGGLPLGPDLVTVMLARGEPVSWLVAAGLGVATAVAAGEVRRRTGGTGVLALAVAALLVPVATGHAADGVGHDLALPALAGHVVAAAVWTGTLGVLVVLRLRDPRATRRAARIGTAAGVATIASGAVAAAVALRGAPHTGTDYTALVLLTAALGVLAGAALWRRRTGRVTRPVELGVLAVVVGLSAVATRAVPPVQAAGAMSTPTAVLGYGLAAAPDPEVLATSWRPDLTALVLAVVLAALYAGGLRRLAAEGARWPAGRSLAWFGGCALLVVATSSGLGRYGPAVLSVHVAGHMLVATAVPLLWALGAPIVLARRTLREAPPGGPEGPAEWLEHVLAAPTLRRASHPLVALVLVVASPVLLYLTPVFALTQPLGWLQPLMTLWFLLVGVLFLGPLVGGAPDGPGLPYLARLTFLLASMPVHALVGLALLATDRPVSRTPVLPAGGGRGQLFVDDFFVRLRLPWAPDLLADQHLAGILTWLLGDLPLLAAVVVVLVAWSRQARTGEADLLVGLGSR